MVHGDDAGLILPPRLAPYQVVVVPIWRKDTEKAAVSAVVERVEKMLKGKVRVKVDLSENTPGWKFNEWELRGVPVRMEIGPRDVQNNSVVPGTAATTASRSRCPWKLWKLACLHC